MSSTVFASCLYGIMRYSTEFQLSNLKLISSEYSKSTVFIALEDDINFRRYLKDFKKFKGTIVLSLEYFSIAWGERIEIIEFLIEFLNETGIRWINYQSSENRVYTTKMAQIATALQQIFPDLKMMVTVQYDFSMLELFIKERVEISMIRVTVSPIQELKDSLVTWNELVQAKILYVQNYIRQKFYIEDDILNQSIGVYIKHFGIGFTKESLNNKKLGGDILKLSDWEEICNYSKESNIGLLTVAMDNAHNTSTAFSSASGSTSSSGKEDRSLKKVFGFGSNKSPQKIQRNAFLKLSDISFKRYGFTTMEDYSLCPFYSWDFLKEPLVIQDADGVVTVLPNYLESLKQDGLSLPGYDLSTQTPSSPPPPHTD